MSKIKVHFNPGLIELLHDLSICTDDELNVRLDDLSLNDLYKLYKMIQIIRLLKEEFENNNDYEFSFYEKGEE